MAEKIHWGIIGLGNIAHKFASDLQLSANAILYGVASRKKEKAKEFGHKFKSNVFYSSYEDLARDPEIDIVYIATPHSFHFEHTMMCLKNGKSVLCEKPLGMNQEEVKLMIDEAKSRNLFLMEGMWTRFIPVTEKLLELIRNNAIGDLSIVRADFGFKSNFDTKTRVYNKNLGGGSLLDVGIYPIYLSLLTLGMPVNINAMARMTATEVDSYCAVLFDYENEAKAILESSIEADTPIEAYIYGSKGHIKIHSRFHHSEKISLYQNGKLKEDFNMKYQGYGYVHEIEEVNKCISNNSPESIKHPLHASLNLIKLVDQVKNIIGLTYN